MELAIAHRSEKRRQENRGETDEKTAKHHEASIKNDVAIDESDAALHHSPAVNVASFRRILRNQQQPYSHSLFSRSWTGSVITSNWSHVFSVLVVPAVFLFLWNSVFAPVRLTDRGVIKVPKNPRTALTVARNGLTL